MPFGGKFEATGNISRGYSCLKMLYDYSFINQSKIVISEVVIPTNHQSEALQERTDPLTFNLSRKLCSTPVDMNAGLQK